MKFFIRGIILGALIGAVATAFVVALFCAIEREMLINQAIKQERCASYGENIPSTLAGYCAGAGA